MGPSGSGKSTVGAFLADTLGARFVDGDDLHPAANVRKMAAGIPLDDTDRQPWLRLVGKSLQEEERIVIACSALRRSYRDLIRTEAPETFFAELAIGRAVLEERMRVRADHFMPAALLDSQLQTLESLEADEYGIRVDESADVQTASAVIVTAARLPR
ncbi:gluconate kinase [Microbacterium sp. MYb54]|nr:gluconate kinase [Microbacterium sp. MYb43]PQZ79832.1 gluconate kinase [Microbacterium sp. MYb40]PRB20200.1 gluconate kinase [Microbacterium sp. MYb54]PRB27485.1 gluconate kinase [Microbacterium sp. MYb50]PRB67382.1 gluconate kinase [Microbacterium sp. MYb24]PRB73534.1 gluconate kinase [Microbacterium sp. MYb32]